MTGLYDEKGVKFLMRNYKKADLCSMIKDKCLECNRLKKDLQDREKEYQHLANEYDDLLQYKNVLRDKIKGLRMTSEMHTFLDEDKSE